MSRHFGVAGQAQVGQRLEDPRHRDGDLHSCQRGAEAVVDPGGERHVRVRVAADVEAVRVGEHVGSRLAAPTSSATRVRAGIRLAAELEVVEEHPLRELHRTGEAQQLLRRPSLARPRRRAPARAGPAHGAGRAGRWRSRWRWSRTRRPAGARARATTSSRSSRSPSSSTATRAASSPSGSRREGSATRSPRNAASAVAESSPRRSFSSSRNRLRSRRGARSRAHPRIGSALRLRDAEELADHLDRKG